MFICAHVLNSSVNGSAEYGLEVYTKCVAWVKKKINNADKAVEARFERSMRYDI